MIATLRGLPLGGRLSECKAKTVFQPRTAMML